MAIKLADTARPNNYVDAEHLGTYPVAYAEDVWFADGTRLSEKTFDGQSIQKEELPLASANEVGNIYQYTGATGTYKNGFFYRCVSDGEPSPTYSWEEIKYVDKPVVYSDTVPNIEKYDMGAIVCYTGEDIPPFQKGHLYIKETRQMNMYDYIAPVIGTGYNVVYSFKEKRDVVVNDVTYVENIVGGYHYFVANGYIESITNDEYTRVTYNSTQTVITTKPEFERTRSNAIVVDWYDIGGGSGGSNIWNGTHNEWDELTSEQKKQYEYATFIDDDDSVNVDVYSTNELKTNKVWIDGKPIYRKVVVDISPNTYVSISDYIETVTNIFWSATSTNLTSSETYNWGSESGTVQSDVWRITDGGVNHNKFYCRGVGGIFGSGKMTLIVEYTKTTD